MTTVAAGRDGSVLVGSDGGLLAFRGSTSKRRITLGTRNDSDPVEPRAITADGRTATRTVLPRLWRLDVLANGSVLALVGGAGGDTRVIAIAPLRRQPRFAVALPAGNRVTLRRGALEVVATRRSRATIRILRAGRTLIKRQASLRAGHNRLRVRVPVVRETLIVAVRAADLDGSVASHRLAFIADTVLSAREMRSTRRRVEQWGGGAVDALDIFSCARRSRQTFRCGWEDRAEGTRIGHGLVTFTLARDGLIRVTLKSAEDGGASRLFYEPRPV